MKRLAFWQLAFWRLDLWGTLSVWAYLSTSDDSKLAVGYSRRLPDGSRSALPRIDARGMAAATGVTSSARDLARFVAW